VFVTVDNGWLHYALQLVQYYFLLLSIYLELYLHSNSSRDGGRPHTPSEGGLSLTYAQGLMLYMKKYLFF